MTKDTLLFVTGNSNKFYEASLVFAKYSTTLVQKNIDIDEIQHHDAIRITEAKAKAAYEVVRQPLVVNDSSWEIPALGGFPGGYMKDVSEWLSTEDFMNLMATKTDKRAFLHEYSCYIDADQLQVFTHTREGQFISVPKGEKGPSFTKIVQMNSDDRTISQIFDKGNWNIDNKLDYKHWYDCAEWYSKNI